MENQQSSFYANIGNAYIESDIQKAEGYLNKSIKIEPNAFAYRSLARIYYKRGECERAKDLWAKALQTDNLYLKSEVMLLVIAYALYLYYRNQKSKIALKETRENLEKYRRQLKLAEAEGKGDSKEVERLTQKISELQMKQNALLQNGRECYEEIMAGGTTLKWSRNDFTDCIEYYRTIDAAFVAHMETDYDHLSSKYIFFALMEHLGKTDEELQHIMAIGQNTIRANRSRISKKKDT